MALIRCNNCGNSVSDRAEKCIHCGCMLKNDIESDSNIFNQNAAENQSETENSESLDYKFTYDNSFWIYDKRSIFGNSKQIKVDDIDNISINKASQDFGTIIVECQGNKEIYKYLYSQDAEAQIVYNEISEMIARKNHFDHPFTYSNNVGGSANVQGNNGNEQISINIDLKRSDLNKGVKFVALGLIAIVAIIAFVFVAKKKKIEDEKKEYKANLSATVSLMYSGGLKAESTASLIHDVWANTIYEREDYTTDKYTKVSSFSNKFNDDFNVSLANLFADSSFESDIDDIKKNQSLVEASMKELINPPDEYREAYESVKDLYDYYLKLTNLAVDPSGNLTSYTSQYNEADSGFANQYKSTKLYIK